MPIPTQKNLETEAGQRLKKEANCMVFVMFTPFHCVEIHAVAINLYLNPRSALGFLLLSLGLGLFTSPYAFNEADTIILYNNTQCVR